MKLLDEIISLLSATGGDLTEALLKTKILLHTIGHKDLVDWVNHELNGYPSRQDAPPYRTLTAQVEGVVTNGFHRYPSFPIPIKHLSKTQQGNLESIAFTESLAVLQKYSCEKKGELALPLPMEFNELLGEQLSSGYHVERAWCSVPVASVTSILVQVRSRLLDFVLSLRDGLPPDAGDSLNRAQASAIDAEQMFKSAIFGDNTTINVGNNNVQTVTNTIVKGDFSSLANALRQNDVREEDIQALSTAIDADKDVVGKGPGGYGPRVRAWLTSMLSKAVETSWRIELSIAGHFLAKALENYYGW